MIVRQNDKMVIEFLNERHSQSSESFIYIVLTNYVINNNFKSFIGVVLDS